MSPDSWVVPVIAVEVIILVVFAIRIRGVLGALLLVQAAYWALSYVVRPTILLTVAPIPQRNDPISDGRLMEWHGSYVEGVALALWPMVIGLATYIVAMMLQSRLPRRDLQPRVFLDLHGLVVLFLIGWMFRIAQLAYPTSTFTTLAFLASVAVGGFILLRPGMPPAPALIVLGASEFVWSLLSAVKAPIFAFILWLVIKIFISSERFDWKRFAGLGAFALLSFLAVQRIKVLDGRLTEISASVANEYPGWMQPLIPVFARFDLLTASTDAVLAGESSWKSPMEALTYGFNALLPQQLTGEKGDLIGRQWGSEVASQSNPAVSGDTYLAQSPAAEGWVIGGWAGLLIECALAAIVVFLIARAICSQHPFFAFLGLAMTSQPFIFERGMLGTMEGVGKGLQIALLATVVALVFVAPRDYAAERERREALLKQRDEAPATPTLR